MSVSALRKVAAWLGLTVLLTACGDQQLPAYNVDNKPLPPNARNLTLYQVEAYINESLRAKGWTADKVGPGEQRATLQWDQASATATIQFSPQAYSIRVVSKSGSGGGGSLDRQYNVRVMQLETEIDRRLKGASP